MLRAARRAGWMSCACLMALQALQPAHADSLREALALAYRTNPTLEAARAQQRATDEGVPIARAAGLPSASVDGTYSEFLVQPANAFTAPERAFSAGADLGVPIYSGGAVKNRIKAAKNRVLAGQEDLRGTESAIFSQVVAAYMDVIQNEALVGLNRSNVNVLTVNLQATRDRFEIGDLTRTDVAQSQSRLALAEGDARNAEANLASSRETYIRLVGKAPIALEAPPPLPNLPATPEAAVITALELNPDIAASKKQVDAAKNDIDVAGAGRLPTVSLYSQGSYNNYFNTLGGAQSALIQQTDRSLQAGARVTVPLFQGGLPAAQRRQAQAQASSALETQIAVERDVIAQTRSAYTSWQAANELIRLQQIAVDAAQLSLEGVRAENSVGNRTILDILNAEQEFVTARSRLVTARRNAYVAGFTLLAAMGVAGADDLNLDGGALYDPNTNYKRVRGKWFDWDTDPAPIAVSTRTVDTPAQDGDIPAQ